MEKKIALILLCFLSIFKVAAQPEYKDTHVVMFGRATQDDTLNREVVDNFYKTIIKSPQEAEMPRFIFADQTGKATFAIGGFIHFRTAYDFNQVVNNLDFETYSIPTRRSAASATRYLTDASFSRMYFKTVINLSRGRHIEGYIEADFRGSQSNSFRMRQAYVHYAGITVGQTITTFCDLEAMPNTIDLQGPCASPYLRTPLIRYEQRIGKNWRFAASVEYTSFEATYLATTGEIPQRVPDIPVFIQYERPQWHLRLSGVFRNMYYYNLADDRACHKLGWGVMGTGSWELGGVTTLYMQYLYGEGVANYISDLTSHPVTLVSDPSNPGQLQASVCHAWYAAVEFKITPKLPMTLCYSQVRLTDPHGFFQGDQYKIGRYGVVNAFYNFTSWFDVGLEYLCGARVNQDGSNGVANRIQAAVRLNF